MSSEESTHSLSVDGVHCEQQGGEEGQPTVVKHTPLTYVHEQGAHHTVQEHVHNMEVQGSHPTQSDVQPEREGEREREREGVR